MISSLTPQKMLKKWFDTSKYPKDHFAENFPVGKNKKVLGMFKDEGGWKNYPRICRIASKVLFRFDGRETTNQKSQRNKEKILSRELLTKIMCACWEEKSFL